MIFAVDDIILNFSKYYKYIIHLCHKGSLNDIHVYHIIVENVIHEWMRGDIS